MFFFYLLLIVEIIVGLLLVGVILLQRSKDQGLGLALGSGMGESLFGSQAVNVLMKITIVLAVVFFLCTLTLARITARTGRGGFDAAVAKRPVAGQSRAPAGVPPQGAVPAGGQDAAVAGSVPIDSGTAVPGGVSGGMPSSPEPVPAAAGPSAPAGAGQ